MPKAGVKATAELAIQLGDSQDTYNRIYCPGDIVIGSVVRKAHTVSTRAWVTIKLYGRAKSKITVRRSNGNNQTTKHYRGRFNFFAPDETYQKLFDGPVHIPPGGDPQTWPFALTIPTGPSPRIVKTGNDQDISYLPLNDAAIAAGSLPASFEFENHGWGKQFHGFVEYHFEAEFWQENKSGRSTATLPISIRAASTPYPIVNFDLKRHTFPGSIKTQRLIPGMETAELSFRQKTQKLFGSSKVPQFLFSVQVDYPGAIQLQNPIPIPFVIRVLPNPERTSDIIADVPQTIALTSLNMELKACTSVVGAGTFRSRSASGTDKYNFALRGTVLNLQDPIIVPSGPDAEALDVGAFLELSLDSWYAYARGKRLQRFTSPLNPGFITYNMKHTHRLKWEVSLTVAGESMSMSDEQPVSVLAASEKQDTQALSK